MGSPAGAGGAGRQRPLLSAGVKDSALTHRYPGPETGSENRGRDLCRLLSGTEEVVGDPPFWYLEEAKL